MYVMFCTHACVFVSSPALLPCDTFPLETHLAQQQSSAVIRRLSLKTEITRRKYNKVQMQPNPSP